MCRCRRSTAERGRPQASSRAWTRRMALHRSKRTSASSCARARCPSARSGSALRSSPRACGPQVSQPRARSGAAAAGHVPGQGHPVAARVREGKDTGAGERRGAVGRVVRVRSRLGVVGAPVPSAVVHPRRVPDGPRPCPARTVKGPFQIPLKRPLTCDSFESGRQDLNLRPLDPQSSALPSCATSRCPSDLGFPQARRAREQYRTPSGDHEPLTGRSGSRVRRPGACRPRGGGSAPPAPPPWP